MVRANWRKKLLIWSQTLDWNDKLSKWSKLQERVRELKNLQNRLKIKHFQMKQKNFKIFLKKKKKNKKCFKTLQVKTLFPNLTKL
jgi:hypothetical protein